MDSTSYWKTWCKALGGSLETSDHVLLGYLRLGRGWQYSGLLDDHNKMIMEQVPKEQLLVMELKDGWEPLCKSFGQTPLFFLRKWSWTTSSAWCQDISFQVDLLPSLVFNCWRNPLSGKFLGKPIPNEPFPHVNDAAAIDAQVKEVLMKAGLVWLSIFATLGGTIYGGLWLWKSKFGTK